MKTSAKDPAPVRHKAVEATDDKIKAAAPHQNPDEGKAEDDVLSAVHSLGEQVASAIGEVSKSTEQLAARIEVIERRSAKEPDAAKADTRSDDERLEQLVTPITERIDELEARLKAPRQEAATRAGLITPEVKAWIEGGMSGELRINGTPIDLSLPVRAKTDVVGSSEVGALAPPTYRPGVIERLEQPIGLLDILQQPPPISGDTYHYSRSTAEGAQGYLRTQIKTAGTGGTTPVNYVVVDAVQGFIPGQTVRIHITGATKELTLVSVDAANNKLVFGTDTVNFDVDVGDGVSTTRYALTAEESSLPAGWIETEDKSQALAALAIFVTVTEQRLRSTTGLSAYLEGKIRDRQRRVLEWHVMYGDATASAKQLAGFFNDTDLVTKKWSDLSTGDTRADLLLWAAAAIPTDRQVYAVLNYLDWQKIIKAKTSDGHYVMTALGPIAIVDTVPLRAIGSLRVVLSAAVTEGEALLLEPTMASELVNNGAAEMVWGYTGSGFTDMKKTVRYSQMWAHALLTATAFNKASFDSAPS